MPSCGRRLRNTSDYKLLPNVDLNSIIYGLSDAVTEIGNKPNKVLAELEQSNIAGMLLERNDASASSDAAVIAVEPIRQKEAA